LSLWKDKAGARAMPAKSEISPRDLKNFLGDIVLCQRVASNPSNYVWRLIGTKVAAVVGHVTGKTFEESAPSGFAARWIECCDLILDGGQPLRFLGRVHIKDREYLDAENFFVPLSNDDGEPVFVMGLCRYTARRYENEESWESYVASITSSMV
jgi:hypothetical protein